MACLSRVSKGMKQCVSVGLEPLLLRKKKDVADYYNFINYRYQTNVLKNAMLDKYQSMIQTGLKGKQRDFCNETHFFATDDASMCLLIFYLRSKAPHVLKHMLHCVIPKWCAFNRRIFRRTHLRVEMYFLSKKKRNLVKQPIKRRADGNTKTNNIMSKQISNRSNSVQESGSSGLSLPNLPLTEENVELHNATGKRRRDHPKRISKKAKLYSEEFQKNVQVQDDFKEEEPLLFDDRSDCSEGIEKRSEDSQSEGSLKDFIVDDEDETEEENNELTEEEHDSSRDETEEESICTDDLSDVFSDDE